MHREPSARISDVGQRGTLLRRSLPKPRRPRRGARALFSRPRVVEIEGRPRLHRVPRANACATAAPALVLGGRR